MISLNEAIPQVLDVFGQDLEFPNGIIKGFVGFQLSSLQEGTDRQAYSFNVSTSEAVDLDIKKEDIFTTEISPFLYTFEVNSTPITSPNGWTYIRANFKSKELL